MTEINYIHTEDIHNHKSAEEILPYIFNLIKPVSVIDVGCGTGSWLSVAKKLGAKTVLGVDGIYIGTQMLCIEKEEFKLQDLTLPLHTDTKYDLAICLEVAEHLPETAADNLIEILTQHSDIILFSAAIPRQEGQFHINEQWPDYWQNKFEKKGYSAFDILRDNFWNNENVEWWYKQNMFIYSKPENGHILGPQVADKEIIARVHPELFKLQIERQLKQEEYFRQFMKDRIWNPKFIPALRLLIKAIIKRKVDS
ncbi:MAG: class I SAM-dependent methyltransferase [Pyrinomonadaceae bacterium]|nr:class I SAM-dependent methyltransferase [Sphingobacteriaceae bacterium]